MADEARVNCGLQIVKDPLEYRSLPTTFTANVTGTKGPVPGALAVSTAGTDVDLSELTDPGLCRIMNLDSTNYMEVGIWDGLEFIPFAEVLPGESYVLRLSRNLRVGPSYGTGTGTTDTGNTLRLKADTASVNALVEAFER